MNPEQERELLRGVDIVGLISEYVTLRRHGREFQGLCPFHNERTPSFSINQEKGSWYCHGCHQGGNALWFLAKIEGISKGEAFRLLAERQGVVISGAAVEREQQNEAIRSRLYAACAAAARFYEEQLSTEAAGPAIAYMRSRGIDRSCAARFGLGYAPNSNDSLFQKLKSLGFTLEESIEAGLCADGEFGPHDRMRHRLIVPIADAQGRPIAFGGRALGDGAPKYLNSPDSALFHKSRTLYLLHQARRSIQTTGKAVVVEGYLDALMAQHYGVENVVATLGTAITPQHVKQLRRLARSIILALDADDAGIRAAERAASLSGEAEMEARIASLPSGMDPDAFLRQFGPDAFREALENAVSIVEFRLAGILKTRDLRSEDGRRNAVQECIKVLASVPSPLQRDRYVDDLARLVSGSQASGEAVLDNIELVREEMVRQVRSARSFRRSGAHRLVVEETKPRLESEQDAAEFELLAALIVHPGLLAHYANLLSAEDFRNPELRTLYDRMTTEGPPEEWIASEENEEVASAAARLMAHAETIVDPETTAADCARKIKDYPRRIRFEELRGKFHELASGALDAISPTEIAEYNQLTRYFKAA